MTAPPPPDPPRDEGEPLPPLPPFYQPSPEEQRPLPRGCHPLVFGVVMATIQFAATVYFMPSCFQHGPG
jgi:hypothetical protein